MKSYQDGYYQKIMTFAKVVGLLLNSKVHSSSITAAAAAAAEGLIAFLSVTSINLRGDAETPASS